MDKYPTKNKTFNTVLETINLHLQKPNFDVHSNVFIDLESTVQNLWKTTKNNQHSPDADTKSHINNFFNTYHSIKVKQNVSQNEWLQFFVCLSNTLLVIDNYKINVIQQSLTTCQAQVESLENNAATKYLQSWFKEFCTEICSTLLLLQTRAKEVAFKCVKDQIFLHMIQMATCLRQFFKLFSTEITRKLLVTENRRYLSKRLIYSFDGIKKILATENEEDCDAGFIQWMDNALNLISDMKPETQSIETVKLSVEEVLCHAMSIAQICTTEDCKKIKAGIQSVLHEFNQLDIEYKKPEVNPSVSNLYVDIVSDKLCLLERKVNIAVLNIALKVFSSYFEPLLKLQTMCEDSDSSIISRSEDDLNDFITKFDTHMDCINQVGLFAAACSTSVEIIGKIRSALASLESLECEVIPALTTLYLEPSNVACIHASLCVDHWREEVENLRNDVCFIIDPIALGQVILDDFKAYVESLELENKSVLTKETINPLCKRTEILLLVIKASISESKLKDDSTILKHWKNLTDIYREVCTAINLLSDSIEPEFIKRVFKRIQILITMIERITLAFSIDDKNETMAKEEKSQLLNENKTEVIDETYISRLQNRGMELLKDRTVLYKTPNKTNKLLPKTSQNVSTKFTEKRKNSLAFMQNAKLDLRDFDSTMDLQITEVLDEITCLGITLT